MLFSLPLANVIWSFPSMLVLSHGFLLFGHLLIPASSIPTPIACPPNYQTNQNLGAPHLPVESQGPHGRRTAVICHKDRATPAKYPRQPGVPAKTPLWDMIFQRLRIFLRRWGCEWLRTRLTTLNLPFNYHLSYCWYKRWNSTILSDFLGSQRLLAHSFLLHEPFVDVDVNLDNFSTQLLCSIFLR